MMTRGSLCGCPVLPGNQVAVDDDNILVLLTGNIPRTGLRQPFLGKPRRALGDAEIDHLGVRKSGHLLAGTPPSVATTTSYPAFVKLSWGKTNSGDQTPPKCFEPSFSDHSVAPVRAMSTLSCSHPPVHVGPCS